MNFVDALTEDPTPVFKNCGSDDLTEQLFAVMSVLKTMGYDNAAKYVFNELSDGLCSMYVEEGRLAADLRLAAKVASDMGCEDASRKLKEDAAEHQGAFRLSSLQQTCWACPSQWEGQLDDGRSVFVHYRHGYLAADVTDYATGEEDRIFGREVSRGDDGVMDTETMIDLIGFQRN